MSGLWLINAATCSGVPCPALSSRAFGSAPASTSAAIMSGISLTSAASRNPAAWCSGVHPYQSRSFG